MAFTDQVTYDSLSLHAVTAPIACRVITLRELATDAAPVGYNVAAPTSSNAVFPKLPLETVVFDAGPGRYFESGVTVGYVQPASGTVTFSRICE
jgi:hypothetical protein